MLQSTPCQLLISCSTRDPWVVPPIQGDEAAGEHRNASCCSLSRQVLERLRINNSSLERYLSRVCCVGYSFHLGLAKNRVVSTRNLGRALRSYSTIATLWIEYQNRPLPYPILDHCNAKFGRVDTRIFTLPNIAHPWHLFLHWAPVPSGPMLVNTKIYFEVHTTLHG